MSRQKDVDAFVRELSKRPGLTVVKGRNGHYQLRRNGHYYLTIPTSPTCSRWRENTEADLRRRARAWRSAGKRVPR